MDCANFKQISCLLVDSKMSPHLSRASSYPRYSEPRIIFRAIFCVLSIRLISDLVRAPFQTGQAISLRHTEVINLLNTRSLSSTCWFTNLLNVTNMHGRCHKQPIIDLGCRLCYLLSVRLLLNK